MFKFRLLIALTTAALASCAVTNRADWTRGERACVRPQDGALLQGGPMSRAEVAKEWEKVFPDSRFCDFAADHPLKIDCDSLKATDSFFKYSTSSRHSGGYLAVRGNCIVAYFPH